MKVGILTFHKAINYGAVLQAYALRKSVNSLGEQCTVIDYVGEKMSREAKVFCFPQQQSVIDKIIYTYRLPMRARTIKKFRQFLKQYLNLSDKSIHTTEELQELSSQYKYFITGSDQVFNYNGTGDDFNYYLEFEKDSNKKIAYAPSFGIKEIDNSHLERVKNNLSLFSSLSARESIGADIVEKLTGNKPQEVCDPTFLLQKEQWEELCTSSQYKKPYVLVYSFGSRHLETYTKKIADEMDGIVVNINRSLPLVFGGQNVRNAYAPSPCEFLSLIKNAEVVVTNSFHGMALSIILQKEFYGFTNNYANSEGTNYRFKTLGEKLGLSHRIYNLGDDIERSPIDYAEVEKKIHSWRDESLNFLKKAITPKQ